MKCFSETVYAMECLEEKEGKYMKKRSLFAVLIMLLMMIFVACGTSGKEENKDSEVQEEVNDNSAENMEELAKKLQVQAAWQAVVSYGKGKYESFEVRYMPGQPVDEIAEDANTWSLKAKCIADGENKTCEAKVTGTTEEPQVISFDVY